MDRAKIAKSTVFSAVLGQKPQFLVQFPIVGKAMYWAEALAAQTKDAALAEAFVKVAKELSSKEDQIVKELNEVQGTACDIDGYYRPSAELAAKAMRPSATLNAALSLIG